MSGTPGRFKDVPRKDVPRTRKSKEVKEVA